MEIRRDGSLLVRAPIGYPSSRIEKLLAEKKAWIERNTVRQLSRMTYPSDPASIEELRKMAKEELIPLAKEMAERFGFRMRSVRITSAKSRFGSCSAENGISLSLFLMLYPKEAREYVVLHELCHTVEHNHSPRFYALLVQVMPDHRERRKLLRK